MVNDRDAKRIYAAAQLAGVKKIDDLVISHFHGDHVGGLAALVKLIPIGRFFDHGDVIEKANQQWLDSYHAVSAGKRTIVKAGDKIPLKGVKVVVVASDKQFIDKAINGGGARNPLCENAEEKAPVTPENQRTIGVLLTYRKFTYLRSDRSRLGKGHGAGVPGQQARHGQRLSDEPSRHHSTARDRRRFSAPSSLRSSS